MTASTPFAESDLCASEQLSSARAPSESLRANVVKLGKYIKEFENAKSEEGGLPPDFHLIDEKGFEECCRSIEKAIAKAHVHARTNEGTQSFKWLLQDKYGASEEDTTKFLDALFFEQGIEAAAHSGQRKATKSYSEFRNEWLKPLGPKSAQKPL